MRSIELSRRHIYLFTQCQLNSPPLSPMAITITEIRRFIKGCIDLYGLIIPHCAQIKHRSHETALFRSFSLFCLVNQLIDLGRTHFAPRYAIVSRWNAFTAHDREEPPICARIPVRACCTLTQSYTRQPSQRRNGQPFICGKPRTGAFPLVDEMRERVSPPSKLKHE